MHAGCRIAHHHEACQHRAVGLRPAVEQGGVVEQGGAVGAVLAHKRAAVGAFGQCPDVAALQLFRGIGLPMVLRSRGRPGNWWVGRGKGGAPGAATTGGAPAVPPAPPPPARTAPPRQHLVLMVVVLALESVLAGNLASQQRC